MDETSVVYLRMKFRLMSVRNILRTNCRIGKKEEDLAQQGYRVDKGAVAAPKRFRMDLGSLTRDEQEISLFFIEADF